MDLVKMLLGDIIPIIHYVCELLKFNSFFIFYSMTFKGHSKKVEIIAIKYKDSG